jgi:hypothetical protein
MSVTSWSQQWIVCASCGEIVLQSRDPSVRRLYHTPRCSFQAPQIRGLVRGELPAKMTRCANPGDWAAELPGPRLPGARRAMRAMAAARHASLRMKGRHRTPGSDAFLAVTPEVIAWSARRNLTGKTVAGLGAGLSVLIVMFALVIGRAGAKAVLPTASPDPPSPVPTTPSSHQPGPRSAAPGPSRRPAGGIPRPAPPLAGIPRTASVLIGLGHGAGRAEPAAGKHHAQADSQSCLRQRPVTADFQFRPFYGGRHDDRRRSPQTSETVTDHGWSDSQPWSARPFAGDGNSATGFVGPSNTWPQSYR